MFDLAQFLGAAYKIQTQKNTKLLNWHICWFNQGGQAREKCSSVLFTACNCHTFLTLQHRSIVKNYGIIPAMWPLLQLRWIGGNQRWRWLCFKSKALKQLAFIIYMQTAAYSGIALNTTRSLISWNNLVPFLHLLKAHYHPAWARESRGVRGCGHSGGLAAGHRHGEILRQLHGRRLHNSRGRGPHDARVSTLSKIILLPCSKWFWRTRRMK